MILILSLVMLVFLLVGPVWAATTGTINVTVSPKLISLSVDPTSYNYGFLDISETAETTITFDVLNNGTVDEDFDIKGIDTVNWNLSGSVGATNYMHEWKEVLGGYAALTTGNVPAATLVGATTSESFKFRLSTPSTVVSTDPQSPNVIFTASES